MNSMPSCLCLSSWLGARTLWSAPKTPVSSTLAEVMGGIWFGITKADECNRYASDLPMILLLFYFVFVFQPPMLQGGIIPPPHLMVYVVGLRVGSDGNGWKANHRPDRASIPHSGFPDSGLRKVHWITGTRYRSRLTMTNALM
jgi:hypothetical protein